MLLVSDCLSVTCPINPRHRNVGKLMVLLNVFHELMVTPPGAKFSAVMTGMDLVLYEHLPTSTLYQRSLVCGVVGYLLEGGCQQVFLDIQL
jgi:hypothetical protein